MSLSSNPGHESFFYHNVFTLFLKLESKSSDPGQLPLFIALFFNLFYGFKSNGWDYKLGYYFVSTYQFEKWEIGWW